MRGELSPETAVLAGLLTVAAVLSVIMSILRARTGSATAARRMRTFVHQATSETEELRPFGERVIQPLLNALTGPLLRFTPRAFVAATQEKIAHAGLGIGAVEFTGIRLAVTLAGLILGGLFAATDQGLPAWQRLLIPFGGFAIGWYVPGVVLSSAAGRRQKAIRKVLPATIETLSISIEAGLSFDGALAHTSQRFKNPLSDELNRTFVEFQMGRTRRQALEDLSRRIGLIEVDRFASLVAQSEAMGVPLSKSLHDQAIELRAGQRQQAQGQARTAPIKMMFPLVLLILPTLFVVILGPTVAQILSGGFL